MARTGIRSSAIIIWHEQILLMHRIKNGDEYWTFPGGGVEEGETWEQAVVREVKEETNLVVLSHKLAFMDQNAEGGSNHPFYICEVGNNNASLGGEEKEKSSKQNFYELQWIPIGEIEKYNLLPESAKQKLLEQIT